MGRAAERLGNLVSERQYDGANYLYRGVPRSFKLLLLAFIVIYAAYWAGSILSVPAPVLAGLFLIMGFFMAIALAITAAKFWPRMEQALPSWFRADVEAPALRPYMKYLTWLGLLLLIFIAGLYTHELVFAVVIFMGVAGGLLVLFIAEAYCLDLLDRLKRRQPRAWMEGAWFSLLLIIAIFFLALIVLIFYGTYAVDGTHQARPILFLLVALVSSFTMVVQFIVLGLFLSVMTYRSWMKRRLARGKAYGGRRTALLKVRPLYLVLYLELMNLATGVYVAFYIFIIAVQGSTMAAEAGVSNPLSSLAMVDGALLDYVALASIIFSWSIILINLSGSAVKSQKWYINRNNFAAATVLIAMAMLLQVITMQGDESMTSLIFRVFYMIGVMIAPLIVFWRRWKAQGRLFSGTITTESGERELT